MLIQKQQQFILSYSFSNLLAKAHLDLKIKIGYLAASHCHFSFSEEIERTKVQFSN